MKSCWREAGLTEEGARRADEALPHLLEGVRALSTGLDSTRTVESFSATLLREVVFRLCELPRLSEAEQRRYATKNRFCLRCQSTTHTTMQHARNSKKR